MKVFGLGILFFVNLLAFSTKMPAQGNRLQDSIPPVVPGKVEAESLRTKAAEAQARIRADQGDSDKLKRAVKLNEVPLAKEILLKNGFTLKDLENAKINLQTGGGKGGEDSIELSVTCCDPKEITIRRTLENFTK